MEAYLEGKKCQTHGKTCVAIKLSSNTSLDEKIQCIRCL